MPFDERYGNEERALYEERARRITGQAAEQDLNLPDNLPDLSKKKGPASPNNITERVQELAAANKDLAVVIESLEKALEPVLVVERPQITSGSITAGSIGGGLSHPESAPLRDKISMELSCVRGATSRLRNIMRRLDL